MLKNISTTKRADHSFWGRRLRTLHSRSPWCDHLLMDQDDPEKRIAELERQLADTRSAAGQDHAGEPQPQFSNTQPIAWQSAVADTHARQYAQPRPSIPRGLTPDMRARRNARFRAQGRAMYAQPGRKQSRENLIGGIIVVLAGLLGGPFTVAMVLTYVAPSSTQWTGAIICSSPYHLEYDVSRFYLPGEVRSNANFQCVSGDKSYDANEWAIVGLQCLVGVIVLSAVAAAGFLMWRRLRKRR